jgi:hypothetical protein
MVDLGTATVKDFEFFTVLSMDCTKEIRREKLKQKCRVPRYN